MVTNWLNKSVLYRWPRALTGVAMALTILLSAGPAHGHNRQGAAQMQAWTDELRADLTQLDALLTTRDLDAIEALVNRTSDKWQKRDRQAFLDYMYKACSLLSSYKFGDQARQAQLLSRYALTVLASGNLPLREHVQFVEFLTLDPLVIEEAEWKGLRAQKAQQWLEAWRRVANSLDPNFNFEERPVMQVRAPVATGLPAGVAPESIKDPKLRAEYEDAIARNAAKIALYNEQHWLKLNAASFLKEAERYLVNAYARPPADLPGLEQLLADYIDDVDVRNRIVADVQQRQTK